MHLDTNGTDLQAGRIARVTSRFTGRFTTPSPLTRSAESLLASPLRGELLGPEGLAERVREVARAQRAVPSARGRRTAPLLARLEESRRVLDAAQERMMAAAADEVDVGPAGEWFLDNYHVVQEQVREVRESLPRGYYRELPELADGRLAGFPRVYELAVTVIAHTEGRIQLETVDLVTAAFQEEVPLSIGELWAIPAMLRLGLLENVRRMAARTVQRLDEVAEADRWADRIRAASEAGGAEIGEALRDFVTRHPPLTAIFVSRLLRQLRRADGGLPPLLWLEQYMAEDGLDAEAASSRSADRLAVTQMVMANSITSLRAVAQMDWKGFVERRSPMEAELRGDPSGHYARMTFDTRDRYRHVVERIAKRTDWAEPAVAAEAVRLAERCAAAQPDDERRAHVGYYLVDHGLAELERVTGYRPATKEAAYRWVMRHPNVVFVGGVATGTLIALAAVFWLGGAGARAAWPLVLLLALLPAADIAVNALNQLVTALLPPRRLPKLELRDLDAGARGDAGIPPEYRTAVVVPTLLESVEAVHDALEHLEVQFLANREANLHFALLGDFTDAPTEVREGDEAVVAAAAAGVRALNARYADAGLSDAFYLFFRPRRWNPRQGVWMGWERKRGKLAEFNRFLRGDADGAFTTIVGNVEPLRRVRFVITLDSDTVLPPDAAALLVGTMAHPLNRAVYDPARGRVVRGYGILQPRVGVSLPVAHRSRFAAIHSGHPGVDPYTTAVSDVYQDLYGEGSFTGKGIYDVDALEAATHGRFPENTLLSHDLIEGNFARAGLVTTVEVFDDYPTRYLTHARRKHRWIRGDWQLLRWLTLHVPGPDGPEPNRLSTLSRWKILDNLRRSLVEISQLLFLLAGWTVLPGSPLRWTLLAVLAVAAPWVLTLLLSAVRPPRGKSWRTYYAGVFHDAIAGARQVGLAIAFLPHQAWISGDAILRTLWRLGVSRRNLLEWQTASHTERQAARGVGDLWRRMWPALVVPLAVFVAAVALELRGWEGWRGAAVPGDDGGLWPLLAAAVPLVAVWVLSPGLAHHLSEPPVRRERRLAQEQRREGMRYALLHWRYFDRFVGPETHWLAPDNFQEAPRPVVAMRTSPTNVGLQILATVSAYDLGFVTAEATVERLERTLDTLDRLPRHRGHFFNWYDLNDLRVLEPAYVSTVDSGNLTGHLIATRQALLTMRDEPVFDARVWHALDTALALALEQPVADTRSERVRESGVREARRALRQRRNAADPVEVLDAVAEPLRLAAGTTAGTVAGATGGEATGEADWVAWCLRLLETQRSRVAGLAFRHSPGRDGETTAVHPTFRELADAGDETASELVVRLDRLAARMDAYVAEVDFRFLYDAQRKLFAIGYQPAVHALDASYYDLLASEARLASFLAVARNDVPVEHWFRLGRTLTRAAGETALVSWSGSMFEYLMPLLVMRSFPFTLLDQTYAGSLRRQIAHGAAHGVPWGVSESAYNLRDRFQTYQYRAFGVADLALKRGLGRDLVVAPYAAAIAVMVDAPRALVNLRALESLGALGAYGFHDAVDYTRPDPGSRYAIVRNYMAHHVGMTLVALTNALTGQRWQRRFHDDPLVRAAELLLHERIPRRLELQEPQEARTDEALPDPEMDQPMVREVHTPDTPLPRVALLGHLPYTIMVSNSGAGYSRYHDLAVTRWHADGTCDDTGQFCYVRDVSTGRVWSAAHQPVRAPADLYHVALATDRVTFHRVDGDLTTRTEIVVAPDDAAEVRRITVMNTGDQVREVELTSYGEVVLTTPEADRAHPAFANLFVETEWHPWCAAITATRRPRSASERVHWCVHVVSAPEEGDEYVGTPTCETDRARFIGRGRSTREPVVLDGDGPLPGTTGAVIDPILAIRQRVRVAPGRSASVAFTTLVATTRELAFELADRYHDPRSARRALDLAWTTTQVELRELGLSPADVALYQELAGYLFHAHPALHAPEAELRRNRGSQPRLWAIGISGDWPIVLASIESVEGLPTLRQLLEAHHYWRRRGMKVDLVILNTRSTTYLQELHDELTSTVYSSSESGMVDQPGGVFLRRADAIDEVDLLMLRATARVHVECDGRSVALLLPRSEPSAASPAASRDDGFARPPQRATPPQGLAVPRSPRRHADARAGRVSADPAGSDSGMPGGVSGGETPREGETPRVAGGASHPALRAWNGWGGLTDDDDYEIHVRGDDLPPAPWINVIANQTGGVIVSESGTGATWAENSYFYRLTPWRNDPVRDLPGDALYLRDEESSALWSATPAPVRTGIAYVVRHGPGVTTFEHEHDAIAATLSIGIAEEDAVRISVLRVVNDSGRPRRLTLTAYAEWTLGVLREHTRHQVQTTFDAELGSILARNSFDPHFADWTSFLALGEPVSEFTADRREFLGRNGDMAAPAALRASARLSGAAGAGLDPCAALRCELRLEPGETREVVVLLGAASDEARARHLAAEYRRPGRATAAAAATVRAWRERLGVVRVRTPEPLFDALVNRWMLYQALGCRMWARSALYQSSGAYGFRDQLQDVMAFLYAEPALAREHILRAAARQFVEGDVQHWWHPQSGRGVRTRFSDDLAWLPYVVDHYVRVTGDESVLDEDVPFLEMRALEPHEHEIYDLPRVSEQRASLYEHCRRALERACTTGAHGLPLIGIGDWNDGMSRVGVEGRGESVWLAWFLIATMRAFAAHAERRGDAAVAATMRARADGYAEAVEEAGWDGEWYRRAYFDDGTPLGSAQSEECRIDSIAQSWSVISGAGRPERQATAMQSLERHLVDEEARLIMLLTPPFDVMPHDPGYIKGYLPGVRENGAQYTHAALWAVLATALRGDGDRAFELFQLLNPLTHAATPEDAAVYKAEPYVVAADVYTAPGQRGRGGWTWYTGSASWMYRVALEAILGFERRADTLVIRPRVPAAWREYEIEYRHGRSVYHIRVRHPHEVARGGAVVELDGRILDGDAIPLVDDGRRHEVIVHGSIARARERERG